MSKALVLSLKNNKIHGDDEILLGGEWVLENQNIEKRKLNYKIFNSKSSLKEIRRKNCVEADKIRNELLDKGVLIEDKDGKTIWKFK